MRNSSAILIFLFGFFLIGLSQKNYLSPIDLSKNLPADNYYSVTSDNKGYLWFSTNQGLGRYNGSEVTYFNTDNGLPDLEIFDCYQDTKSRIWFRTLNGKICYFQNGRFHNLSEKDNPKLKSFITSIVEFNTHIYFGATSGQVLMFDGKTLKEVFWDEKIGIHEIIPFRNKLVFVSPAGLIDFYPSTGETKMTKRFLDRKSFIRATRIKNTLLLSNANQLMGYDLVTGNIEEIINFKSEIISLEILEKSLWVGTRSGGYKLNYLEGSNAKVVGSVLSDKEVTSVCKDFQGGLWITTLHDGVFHRSLAHLKEIFQTHPFEEYGHISNFSVTVDNEFLIGFSKNHIGFGEIDNIKLRKVSSSRQLPIKKIRKIQSNYFAMTGNTILYSHDSFGNRNQYFSFPANDVTIDGAGSYIIAGNYLRSISQASFRSYLSDHETGRLDNDVFHEILKKRVNCLRYLSKGRVAVGTVDGCYLLKEGVLEEVKYKEASFGHITSIEQMNNGRILISTLTKGVFIEQRHGEIKNLTIKDGLNSSSSTKIIGNDSTLWVLTSRGLNQIQIISKDSLRIIDASDLVGPLQGKITDIGFYKDRLVFSTANRILSISKWTSEITPPKIRLAQITANGKLIKENSVNLYAGNNRISFTFENISFHGQKTVEHEFRLKGSSNIWRPTKSKSVQFESLPYGDYTFELRVKSAFGATSKIVTYQFSVEEVFYKKTWFIILEITVIAILILLIVIFRLRSVKNRFLKKQRRIAIEHELKELEQQALRLQMNPHFIFNALNTIKGFYSSKEVLKANEYITKFSSMLRQILEHQESTITLKKEIDTLELYIDLIRLRYSSTFSFEVTTEPEINLEQTVIPAMLIQPFVENAVIHGIAPKLDLGVIRVDIKREKELLICTIRDNGVGRKGIKSQHLKTDRVNATGIVSRRLEILREEYNLDLNITIKDLKKESSTTGTEVKLTLPYIEQW